MQFSCVLGAAQRAHSFVVWATRGIFSLHWSELLPFLANLETGRNGGQEAAPSNFQALNGTCRGLGHSSHTSAAFMPSGFGPSCSPGTTSSLETAAREGCKGTLVAARVQRGMLRDITVCYSSQLLEERL